MELDQGEEPARIYFGFFCFLLSSTIAWSVVSSQTSRDCRETFCLERTRSSYEGQRAQSEQSYPSKNLPPTLGAPCASISAPEPAPRRAGPCRHRLAGCRGIGRTRTLGVGPRRGWGLLPECARTPASPPAYCTVPAAVPSARAHARSISVSASMVPPRKSSRRVALSQGCRENRKRHLRPDRCQLLIMERQAMNLLIDTQNTRCLSTSLASISLTAVGILCSPAAFRFRDQQ